MDRFDPRPRAMGAVPRRAGMAASCIAQAAPRPAGPAWRRADPGVTALPLARPVGCGAQFMIGGTAAAPSSPEA